MHSDGVFGYCDMGYAIRIGSVRVQSRPTGESESCDVVVHSEIVETLYVHVKIYFKYQTSHNVKYYCEYRSCHLLVCIIHTACILQHPTELHLNPSSKPSYYPGFDSYSYSSSVYLSPYHDSCPASYPYLYLDSYFSPSYRVSHTFHDF